MRILLTSALFSLLVGCATAPPIAPGIAGAYDLVSVDGRPLPSADNIVDGTLELRGNRTFVWSFTMQEIGPEGERSLVPIVFEGRFAIAPQTGPEIPIHLTRRDRASSMTGNQEEIEGILTGETLTFTTVDLNAVFRKRR